MSKKQSNPPPPVGAVKPPPPTSPPPRTDTAGRVYAFGRPLSLPVLSNHNPQAVIGVFEMLADGRLVGTFKPGTITRETLLCLSGGYKLLELEERDGTTYVRKAELMCLSDVLNPTQPQGKTK